MSRDDAERGSARGAPTPFLRFRMCVFGLPDVRMAGEVFDGLHQALPQLHRWRPSQLFFGSRNVWLPDLRIVNGKLVIHNRRLRCRQLYDHLGQLFDREFLGISDVRGFGVSVHEQAIEPFHFVIDVAEATRLRAVSINGAFS